MYTWSTYSSIKYRVSVQYSGFPKSITCPFVYSTLKYAFQELGPSLRMHSTRYSNGHFKYSVLEVRIEVLGTWSTHRSAQYLKYVLKYSILEVLIEVLSTWSIYWSTDNFEVLTPWITRYSKYSELTQILQVLFTSIRTVSAYTVFSETDGKRLWLHRAWRIVGKRDLRRFVSHDRGGDEWIRHDEWINEQVENDFLKLIGAGRIHQVVQIRIVVLSIGIVLSTLFVRNPPLRSLVLHVLSATNTAYNVYFKHSIRQYVLQVLIQLQKRFIL